MKKNYSNTEVPTTIGLQNYDNYLSTASASRLENSEVVIFQRPSGPVSVTNGVMNSPCSYSINNSNLNNEFGIPNPIYTSRVADYDPYQHIDNKAPTSMMGTMIHIFMISAGPAIFSIPISFLQVGWVWGFISTILITFFYAYNMHLISWSQYEVCKFRNIPQMSYSQLVYNVFTDGPKCLQKYNWFAKMFINIVFILLWLMACCYCFVVVQENSQLAVKELTGKEISIGTITFITFFFLVALCNVRKLSYFVPFSIAGNIFNFICIFIVLYDVFSNGLPYGEKPPAFGSFSALVVYLGTVLFSLNATGLILSLKDEMKKPEKFDGVTGVLGISYTVISACYAFFGIVCSLKYSYNLKDSVIQNLDETNKVSGVIILFSTLSLIFQYPLVFYVVFDVLWNNLMMNPKSKWSTHVREVTEYAIRFGINLVALLLALAVPNVALFLTLGGAVFTAFDSMIFPAILETLVVWRISGDGENFMVTALKNAAIITFAVVLMVSGVVESIEKIAQHYTINE